MDTQDIAKFTLRSLQLTKTINKTFFLCGLKRWTNSKLINICEQLAGQKANIKQVPSFFINLMGRFFGFFEWGETISERFAFIELLGMENNFSKSTFELYKIFKIDNDEIMQLDEYFLEYFITLVKRLRDINFEDIQKQKNLII